VVTKAHIVSEIVRTAKANKGVPLGRRQFYAETGIKETDWLGKHWARWGDAITEAGLTPNTLQVGYGEERLLERLASFARELGRFPGRNDIQLKARLDKGFPHPTTFQRLGLKSELAAKLAKFCESKTGYDDVREFCTLATPEERGEQSAGVEETFGSVYLLKSGRFYKIGRSNAVGRRERELQIQLPERAASVHSIKTDDPVGIEDYWHRRFADRRKNGEWFELTSRDVAAFKRRNYVRVRCPAAGMALEMSPCGRVY
jgi:Meiotically Up-regulated Gene 113 (MUG113) protein